MSEERPPSTDRWLPWIGLALIAEALLILAPPVEQYRQSSNFYGTPLSRIFLFVGQGILPGLLGGAMLATLRRPSAVAVSVWAAFACIVGMSLESFAAWTVADFKGRILWTFLPTSALLSSIAAPILWGSALARRENPASLPLQKLGRISAGVIQLSFVFQFVAQVPQARGFASMGSSVDPSFVIWSLGEVVGNLILLWATIEALRTNPDESAVRFRAERTHKLMRVWLGVFAGVAIVIQLVQIANSRDYRSLVVQLWSTTEFVTIQVAAGFVLARRYRVQFPASSPPLERSGGVVSTGESS
jgi:hypothetical protein